MKRIALLLVALCFPWILILGQEVLWMPVPDVETGVSVEMSDLPKFERKTVYQKEQYVIKDVFSHNDGKLEYVFEIQPLEDASKKSASRSMDKAVDFLALYEKGQLGRKEKRSGKGLDYWYVEIELAGGNRIRSILFAHKGKMFHLYVKGRPVDVFGPDANYYLDSWSPGEQVAVLPETSPKDMDGADDISVPNTWETIEVNGELEVSFPKTPFRKSTLVEFGTRNFVIDAFSRYSDRYRLNYVLTSKTFGPGEGQLRDDELYEYIVSRIVELEKVKLNGSADVDGNGFEAREYLLSKGIRFYKLQLFRIDNTIYQCLVKGKRKSIDKPAASRFFNSIKTLD